VFDDLLESVAARKRTKKRWTVAASAAFQSAFLASLMLIPLIRTQALPIMMLSTILVAPAPPNPSPPPQPPQRQPMRPLPRLLKDNVLHEPIAIPKRVTMLVEPDLPPNLPSGTGLGNGTEGMDLLKSMQGSATVAAGPAPPPPIAVQRIRIGGQIQAAKVISARPPVYPALARQARIQGTVILHAIIDPDGRVGELRVISGHPLLARAALEAVRLWRYLPTRLNGQPVEVETTVTVKFVLVR
jgi:periplasmic protein TonB